jgi:transcriptional regulator with XRE-family HTH domain
MAPHSWLHTLLHRSGISQEDLAGFLHISRSAVNMACRRERSLPTAANLQLLKIEQAMETLPPGQGSPFTSYAPFIQHFTQRAQELRYEAATMERYIGKYELKMRQWEQRERFWRAAGTLVPEGAEGKRQSKWLTVFLPTLTHTPGQADKQYYRFKAQMPLLLQETEMYEKWVEEWEKEESNPIVLQVRLMVTIGYSPKFHEENNDLSNY